MAGLARPDFSLRFKAAGLLVLMIAVLILAGCGVKTPPYPAKDVLPAAPRDLSQALEPDGSLVLRFNPPDKNMLGRPLKDLSGFKVEMASELLTPDFCPGCPRRFEEVATVPAGTPPLGQFIPSGPFYYSVKLDRGRVYTFRIYSVSSRGAHHLGSRVEAVVWALSPPPEPENFQARLGDRAVELSWRPFSLNSLNLPKAVKDKARLSFELERRIEGGAWAAVLKDPEAHLENSYTDYQVNYGQSLSYRLRWLIMVDETRVYGPFSPVGGLAVADITPPAPPAKIFAAPSALGVNLNWDESPDADLAGYNVYRRKNGETEFRRINKSLVFGPGFVDEETTANEAVYYQVTAVDESDRANESAPSPPARVWVEPKEEIPPRPSPPPLED